MILAQNRRAFYDFDIKEPLEVGIVLLGHEVKSIKQGQIDINRAQIIISQGEAWLINAHVSPYKKAGVLPNYNPARSKKLLLNKKELNSLIGIQKTGLTLVPVKVYTKHGRIKLEMALARRKRKYDKKELIKKKEIEKDIRRSLRE